MLVCDWVGPSQDPRHQDIEPDGYGFTVANFNRMDGKVHSNSFAFPLHCQHVFLSNDPTRATTINQCMPNVIDVGNDGDFLVLQPRVEDAEPTREPTANDSVYILATIDDCGQEDHEKTQ